MTVSFELTSSAQVQVAVYDVLGRKLDVLHNSFTGAGLHRITFVRSFASGVYIVRMSIGSPESGIGTIIDKSVIAVD
jgi:hypothetical protein